MNNSVTGFTGISFPFRINSKGGVTMSTTGITDVPHIVEAVEQILLTKPRERRMEYHFKSDLNLDIFEPNDSSAKNLIEHQIKEALSVLEDRIELTKVDVKQKDNIATAEITFRVLKYGITYSSQIPLGSSND